MYSRKSLGPRIQALTDSSINWIFLWRLPIHKYMKHFISKKRRNKAKYLSWNYTRLNFVKKTSMQNTVKSLQYIKWSFVKSPCNSTRYNCQEISSWLRRPKFMLEIKKKARFIYVILLFTSFSKILLIKERRLTGQQFLATDLSQTFFNTWTTNETFQHQENKDSFRQILRSTASMYKGSGS